MRLVRAAARAALRAVLLLAALTTASPAATGIDASERLQRIDREIERLDSERRRLAAGERGVLGRLERLAAEARLIDARVEKLGLEQEAAEQAVADVDGRLAGVEDELAREQSKLARTMRVLHRLGPLGRLRPLLSAPSAESIAGGIRVVAELGERQRGHVAAIRRGFVELESLREMRRGVLAETERLRESAASSQRAMRRTIEEREALLVELRQKQTVRDEAIAELGRAQKELARIIAAGGTAGAAMPKLDVHAFRGLLPLPVEGKITRPFGSRRDPRFGTVLPHRGWDIDAEFGAPVESIFAGAVAWTGWLRGYGLVVVVDHGGGVHSVYAHLSVVLVETGGVVEQGEQIGRVGDTGSLAGPMLYVEMREQGRAVDPSLWIDRARP